MNELSVTSIINHKKYEQAIVEDNRVTLSNLWAACDADEYNRLIDLANHSEKFYKFLPLYNYAGILTYDDNIGFELNLFRFDSLDDVFDLYGTFDSLEWSLQDKNEFTKIVDRILESDIEPATLSIVEVEDY